jgi:hypothetical protein
MLDTCAINIIAVVPIGAVYTVVPGLLVSTAVLVLNVFNGNCAIVNPFM